MKIYWRFLQPQDMQIKQTKITALLLASFLASGFCKGAEDPCVLPGAVTAEVRALPGLPGSGVVDSFAFIEGVPVVVVDGIAWAQDPDTCQWVFAIEMYDPAYYENTFFMKDGRWYHQPESGEAMLTSTEFADDFEDGSTVVDLLPLDGSRYTSFALLSPQAPTISAYNALRNCLIAGTCDFLDNRIDFDPQGDRNGGQSLRFFAVAPSPEMITSKSLVERGLFFFRKGDSLWFSGWYKAEGTLPFTILDLETSGIRLHPGIRVTVRNRALSAELKWLDKPQYLQKQGEEVEFPLDQWVHVRVYVLFSEDEFGKIEIWQDGVQVVSEQGRTLPTTDSVIDIMQIGITATSNENIFHIDDVRVSKMPIRDPIDKPAPRQRDP